MRARTAPFTAVAIAAMAVVTFAASSCGVFPGPKVVVMGDSIIHWNRERITAELEDCCRAEVEGFPGVRVDQMVDPAAEMAATGPKVAIIDLGTNDALQVTDVANTRLAMTGLIDAFADARCVYLVNVSTGIGGAPNVDRADQVNAAAAEINTVYEELAAADDRVDVIDWNTVVAEAFTEGRNLTRDRVHPNEEGVQALTSEFRAAIDRCSS